MRSKRQGAGKDREGGPLNALTAGAGEEQRISLPALEFVVVSPPSPSPSASIFVVLICLNLCSGGQASNGDLT